MLVLGAMGAVISLVCLVIILIHAFQDEVWKGLVGLLCMLYLVYYAIMEFDHERKWLIVLGWILGAALGGVSVGPILDHRFQVF
jgi:hypothetical protein